MKRAIEFLQFVMDNYEWSPGGQEWTDKKCKYAYTEKEMYKAFADQHRAAKLLVRPEIKNDNV